MKIKFNEKEFRENSKLFCKCLSEGKFDEAIPIMTILLKMFNFALKVSVVRSVLKKVYDNWQKKVQSGIYLPLFLSSSSTTNYILVII
jgi:hypothetical protein